MYEIGVDQLHLEAGLVKAANELKHHCHTLNKKSARAPKFQLLVTWAVSWYRGYRKYVHKIMVFGTRKCHRQRLNCGRSVCTRL